MHVLIVTLDDNATDQQGEAILDEIERTYDAVKRVERYSEVKEVRIVYDG